MKKFRFYIYCAKPEEKSMHRVACFSVKKYRDQAVDAMLIMFPEKDWFVLQEPK